MIRVVHPCRLRRRPGSRLHSDRRGFSNLAPTCWHSIVIRYVPANVDQHTDEKNFQDKTHMNQIGILVRWKSNILARVIDHQGICVFRDDAQ
jgi:hypothetical protein